MRARCISPRHTEAFSHSKLLHREALHRASFYTEQTFSQSKLLHREAFTHRSFCTQQALTHSKLLHRDFFSHSKLLHREALHRASFYTEQNNSTASRKERKGHLETSVTLLPKHRSQPSCSYYNPVYDSQLQKKYSQYSACSCSSEEPCRSHPSAICKR